MDYFKNLANSFPEPLPPEEQEQLLKEFFDTQNQDIRQKLLEHNLRLALKIAHSLCIRYNRLEMIDQMFSLCYEELANSLDRYDPYHQTQANFSTYAINNMKLMPVRTLTNETLRSHHNVDTVFISDSEEADMFIFLHDQSQNVTETIESKMFIEDISRYIDTLPYGQHLKMTLGLGYNKRYSYREIAKELGGTYQNIQQNVATQMIKLKNYIAKKYPNVVPQEFKNNAQKKLNFNTNEARNQYIYESYYGLNGKPQKSLKELSLEVGLKDSRIKEIAYKSKDMQSQENQEQLSRNKVVYRQEITNAETIFNDYYGINGSTMLSLSQISKKYGVGEKVIHSISEKFIETGKYTKKEITYLKETRKSRKEKQTLNKYAYIYFSYYGLNGHTQKARFELANELNLTVSGIEHAIQRYQNYLNSLPQQQREAEIAKYAKQLEME